ncbi:MAG: hypothetical protein ACE366_29410 [Bradymonadia bacterium]
MRWLALTLAAVLAAGVAHADDLTSAVHPGALLQRMEALENTGRALYVSAAPGSENHRLLAWLAQGRRVHTATLAITRGGAGHNRLGPERGSLLSVLRADEFQASHRVDGVRIFTTGARDFGAAHTAEGALEAWGHEGTLGDLVRAIRVFRPHVIITEAPVSGDGQRLAAAQLVQEAFEAAGDSSRFAEQLKSARPWSPVRLLHDMGAGAEESPGDLLVEVSGYAPLLGENLGDIARESAAAYHTLHGLQKPAPAGADGPRIEILRPVAGAQATFDLFEGVSQGWAGLAGGAGVSAALAEARTAFRPQAPHSALPALARALAAARALGEPDLRRWAVQALERLMVDCAGLTLSATARAEAVIPGDKVSIRLGAVLRGRREVRLRGVTVALTSADEGEGRAETSMKPALLSPQAAWRESLTLKIPADASVSTVPWLSRPPTGGRYTLPEGAMPNVLWGQAPIEATFTVEIAGAVIDIVRPVTEGLSAPLDRPVGVVPPMWLQPKDKLLMRPEKEEGRLTVEVVAVKSGEGVVTLKAPRGWRVKPAQKKVKLKAGARKAVTFTVTPRSSARAGTAQWAISSGDRTWHWGAQIVGGRHTPLRHVPVIAEANVVPGELELPRGWIGYLPAPGDSLMQKLRQMGLKIRALDALDLASGPLFELPVVVLGPGVFGDHEALDRHSRRLKAYVRQGGRLVILGGVPGSAGALESLPPKSLTLSTVQALEADGAVKLLQRLDPLMVTPNRLSDADFEGWVEGRASALPERWDGAYSALVEVADEGQKKQRGALLSLNYGRGTFIYTALDLAPQIAAGVPGAYRLLGNLLSPPK